MLHVFDANHSGQWNGKVAIELDTIIAVWEEDNGGSQIWIKWSGPTETFRVKTPFAEVMALLHNAGK